MTKPRDTGGLRASLRELAHLGSPVDLAVADVVGANHQLENGKLEIEQVGGVHESYIYTLKDGRAAFVVPLRITNRTAKAIYPIDMEMEPFWHASTMDWLEPRYVAVNQCKKPGSIYECYRFPDGLQFPVDQVLNHVIFGHQRLMPKKPVEGLLLATGGRMPADLRHGQMLDVVLTITGSDHAEYRAPINLFVDRVVYQPKPEKAKTIVLGRQAGGLDGAPAITDSALPGSRATGVAPDVALAELIPLTNLVE